MTDNFDHQIYLNSCDQIQEIVIIESLSQRYKQKYDIRYISK
jgi:hypothetical protein